MCESLCLPAYQCHTLGNVSVVLLVMILCVSERFFFSRFVFMQSVESARWRGIWLERMLPAERVLVSCQRPLIDTLPNAVGLKYKSSSPLPGTYAHRAPEPISRCSPSRLPFAFTPLCLSYLCRSQSLAASCSLSTSVTKPRRAPRHFISIYLSVSRSSLSACH